MGFSIQAADHTGITVHDLDRALEFWRDALGFTVERRAHLTGDFAAAVVGVPGADIRTAIVAVPGHRIELLEYHSPPRPPSTEHGPEVPGSMHLAFTVEGLDDLLARAARAGFTPPGEVRTMSSGPRAGTRFVYVRDPDGTTVEFIEPPTPATIPGRPRTATPRTPTRHP